MADLVGEAYVRITADTTPMRRAIKRAAKEGAAEYTSEFGREVEAAADRKLLRARARLAEALVDPGEFDRWRSEFDSVADAAGNFRLQLEGLRKSGALNKAEFKSLTTQISRWERSAAKAEEATRLLAEQKKQEAEETERLRLSMKQVEEQRRQEFRDTEVLLLQARRAAVERERQRDKEIEQSRRWEAAQIRAAEKVRDARRREADAAVREYDRVVIAQRRAFDSYLKNINFTRTQEILRRTDTHLTHVSRSVGRFNDRLRVSGDIVARVFGKGARNNFFNLFGRSIELLATGPIRLLAGALSGISGIVGDMVGSFRRVRIEGGSTISALAASTGTLLTSLVAIVPALVATSAALGALIFVLPAAAAAFSMLAGSLSVVVGALTLGLIGALLPLAPLLLSVAAAGGAVFAVFNRMNTEGTKAEEALNRIKRSVKGLVKDNAREIDRVAGVIGRVVSSGVRALDPIFKGALQGLEAFVESMAATLDSKGVRRAFDNIGSNLPRLLGTLGSALGGLTSGLVIFFDEITPYTQRLIDGFDNLADRFSNWIKSAEGKNSLADFMDRAFDAAESLWDILGNVTSALGKLFGIGQEETGKSFLGYLEDITERFDNFLSSPEGKEQVKDYFRQVGDFMRDVKNLFGDIARAFDELDSGQAREDLNQFLEAMRKVTGGIIWLAENFENARTAILLVTTPVLGMVELFRMAYGALFGEEGYVVRLVDSIQEWFSSIPAKVGSGLNPVPGKVSEAFRSAYTAAARWVLRLPQAVVENWQKIPGLAARALGSVVARVVEPFAQARSRVVGALAQFRSNVRAGIAAIPGLVRSGLSTLASTFSAPFIAAYSRVSSWVARIKALISNLGSLVGGAVQAVRDSLPNIPGLAFASGGIVSGPTRALVGEAGPEAIVPLNRPLSRVDPSVRGLAAVAQGKAFASGGIAGGRSVVINEGAIVISSNATDPNILAEMVLDRIAMLAN